MEAIIIYFTAMIPTVGTVVEIIKKLFPKLSDGWYKPMAILASAAVSVYGALAFGDFSWATLIVGFLVLGFAQFGWDFGVAKPIIKKIFGLK